MAVVTQITGLGLETSGEVLYPNKVERIQQSIVD